DLQNHHAVHYFSSRSGRNCNWDFVIDGKTREVDVPGCVSVNDWSAHLACALQGFGLVQTARFMALPHLQAGELIEVLPQWKPRSVPISLLYPQSRQLSPKVRVFSDWVAELFSRCPLLNGGDGSEPCADIGKPELTPAAERATRLGRSVECDCVLQRARRARIDELAQAAQGLSPDGRRRPYCIFVRRFHAALTRYMHQPVLPAYLIARWLLLLLLLAGAYFLSGFLVPALAALIIGLATWPVFRRVVDRCGGRTIPAATVMLLGVILILIIPLTLALTYAVKEASNFFAWALAANRYGVAVPDWISSLPGVGPRLAVYWQTYLGEPHALGAMVEMVSGEHLGNIYRMVLSATGNAFQLLLSVVFMLITLFFVYKDGDRMIAQLDVLGERILPARWQRFSRVVPATVGSTVTGMSLIAAGEGVVLGIAYWLAGVPSPVLLGVVTGFMALI